MKNFITTEIHGMPSNCDLYKQIKSVSNYDNMFWFYYQFEKTVSIDRFGYANKYIPFEAYKEPIAEFPSFTFKSSFEDCVEKRMKEYLDMAMKENKKIVISLSGGVDSVCVTSAYFLYGGDKNNLIILYSASTIKEYPAFFEFLKKENIKMQMVDRNNIYMYYYYYSKNHILIFGNAGDQIWGSAVNLNYPDWFHKSWKDFCIYCNGTDKTIEQMEDVFDHYKINVQETCEFLWWLCFSIKYTKVILAENIELHIPYTFHAFFDTYDFNSWACTHYDNKRLALPTEPKYYRLAEKALIYKFTKDKNYYDTKCKVKPSYGEFVFYKRNDRLISYVTKDGFYTCSRRDFTFL